MTDRVSRIGHSAPAQAPANPDISSSVSRSSSAEAVTRVAPARSSGRSRAMSDRLASAVTRRPFAAEPGGSAMAISNRSASRSCRIQCCGPGSSGASHRPIAPVPQPRSWITWRRVAGSAAARCPTSPRAWAAASAGSRRASHLGLTRVLSAVTGSPRRGALQRRTRWSTTGTASRAARGRSAATAPSARGP